MGAVLCVEYSGGEKAAYALALYDPSASSRLAGQLPWLRHPSGIRGRFSKRRYLEGFPRRFCERLHPLLLYYSVVGSLPRLMGEIGWAVQRFPVGRVYLDYHLYNKASIRGMLRGHEVVPENKAALTLGKEGRAALAVFYALDALMLIYKRWGWKRVPRCRP